MDNPRRSYILAEMGDKMKIERNSLLRDEFSSILKVNWKTPLNTLHVRKNSEMSERPLAEGLIQQAKT